MKITIKKGVSIQKANEALQFFAESHDCEFSYPLTLQKDVTFELVVKNSYDDNLVLFDEYVISPEYVNEMDNTKRKQHEWYCREVLFPKNWWEYGSEINKNIIKCKKELTKLDKLIQDAPSAGRLPRTIEKYQRKRILLQNELLELEKLPHLYHELNTLYKHNKICFEYIKDSYAITFTYEQTKYAFTTNEYDQSHLFEIIDDNIIKLL